MIISIHVSRGVGREDKMKKNSTNLEVNLGSEEMGSMGSHHQFLGVGSREAIGDMAEGEVMEVRKDGMRGSTGGR